MPCPLALDPWPFSSNRAPSEKSMRAPFGQLSQTALNGALLPGLKAAGCPEGTLHLRDDHDSEHSIVLHEVIGEGGFGTVYTAISNNCRCALKMVGHGGDAEGLADIAREVAVQRHLTADGSDAFVALHAHITESVRSHILMDLCMGVDLEAHVMEQPHGRLTEVDARPLAARLLDAVAACHAADVVHLDIQPRNVLVQDPARPGLLKLIDYGSSRFIGAQTAAQRHALGDAESEIAEAARGRVTERGGAPNYRAPERHEADEAVEDDADDDEKESGQVFFDGVKADAYGIGATLFFMLTGRDAFDWVDEGDDYRDELLDDIQAGRIPFDKRVYPAPPAELSLPVRALISQIMVYEPLERPTPSEALQHPWLCDALQGAKAVVATGTPDTCDAYDVALQLAGLSVM